MQEDVVLVQVSLTDAKPVRLIMEIQNVLLAMLSINFLELSVVILVLINILIKMEDVTLV
jgi:hypothetical protein